MKLKDFIKNEVYLKPHSFSLFCLFLLAGQIISSPARLHSEDIRLDAGLIKLHFTDSGSTPVFIESQFHSAIDKRDRKFIFGGDQDLPLLEIGIKGNDSLWRNLNQLPYNHEHTQEGEIVSIEFNPELPSDSLVLISTYTINKNKYIIGYSFQISGVNADSFIRNHRIGIIIRPPDNLNNIAKTVLIRKNRADYIHSDKKYFDNTLIRNTDWIGFRKKYWVLLYRPSCDSNFVTYYESGDKNSIIIEMRPDSTVIDIEIFAGPVESGTLKEQIPKISGLLFSGQWFFIRWICLGLLEILNGLIILTGNHGLAIILLSPCVKILMAPLTFIADKWQKQVNTNKSALFPVIERIKAESGGEEQNRRILQAHKDMGIHPFYTLKSLFGVMIQIPVFFAAYHLLDENIVLNSIRFLWINDLSLPDGIMKLPVFIPYLGNSINLLPFLMTIITIITSFIFRENSLSPQLQRKQRLNLYIMAVLFFMLFYTFPAGMVLYWTTNNFLSLLNATIKNRLKK